MFSSTSNSVDRINESRRKDFVVKILKILQSALFHGISDPFNIPFLIYYDEDFKKYICIYCDIDRKGDVIRIIIKPLTGETETPNSITYQMDSELVIEVTDFNYLKNITENTESMKKFFENILLAKLFDLYPKVEDVAGLFKLAYTYGNTCDLHGLIKFYEKIRNIVVNVANVVRELIDQYDKSITRDLVIPRFLQDYGLDGCVLTTVKLMNKCWRHCLHYSCKTNNVYFIDYYSFPHTGEIFVIEYTGSDRRFTIPLRSIYYDRDSYSFLLKLSVSIDTRNKLAIELLEKFSKTLVEYYNEFKQQYQLNTLDHEKIESLRNYLVKPVSMSKTVLLRLEELSKRAREIFIEVYVYILLPLVDLYSLNTMFNIEYYDKLHINGYVSAQLRKYSGDVKYILHVNSESIDIQCENASYINELISKLEKAVKENRIDEISKVYEITGSLYALGKSYGEYVVESIKYLENILERIM